MDLSAISSSYASSTLSSAKFSKAENTAKQFQTALEEASDKVNSEDATSEDDAALKEMCDEFEKYFLEQMYKSMRSTLNTENSLIYGGQAEELFQEQLDQQYVDAAVKQGGIGLSKQLYEQLKSPTSSTGAALNNKVNETTNAASKEIKVETNTEIQK